MIGKHIFIAILCLHNYDNLLVEMKLVQFKSVAEVIFENAIRVFLFRIVDTGAVFCFVFPLVHSSCDY